VAVLAFALGGFSAGTTAVSDPACRPDASAGRARPERLSIQSELRGRDRDHRVRNSSRSVETDGDWSFDIQVDLATPGTYGQIMHAEIVPQD